MPRTARSGDGIPIEQAPLVLYPNLMMGLVILLRPGPPPDYRTTVLIGLVLSVVQGILALFHRHGRE